MARARVSPSFTSVTKRKELLKCEGEFLEVQKRNACGAMSVSRDAQDLKTDRNNPPAVQLGCPVGRLTNRRMLETEITNVWGISRHSKSVPGAGRRLGPGQNSGRWRRSCT